jgi:hypothetical protein
VQNCVAPGTEKHLEHKGFSLSIENQRTKDADAFTQRKASGDAIECDYISKMKTVKL